MPVDFENSNNTFKKNVFRALTNPLFIALILTLPLLFFIPKTEKYQVSQIGQSNSVFLIDPYIKHYDLNNDGETETIYSGNNQRDNHSIVILHPDGKVMNQWNFRGNAPKKGERFFVGDANGNGFNEVYVFSQVEDSIFLNYFEPYNPEHISVKNIFIDKIDKTDGDVDFRIFSPQLCRLENDFAESLLFAISAGFSIQPRKVYSYNTLTEVVQRSPASGALFYDFNCVEGDSGDETKIFCTNFAPGNMRSHMQIPYSDSSVWVMAFDKNLDFLFPPIEFPGFNRHVQTYPFYGDDELRFLAYTHSNAICDTCQLLLLYDLEGTELARKELFDHPDGTLVLLYNLFAKNQPPILFSPETGNLFEVGKSLELKFRGEIPALGHFTSRIQSLDFDNDGKGDFFALRFSNGIVLLDKDLKPVATHSIDNIDNIFDYTVGVKRRKGQKEKEFSFQAGSNQVVLSLSPNRLHHLKWFILLGYYFGVTAIVYLSQRIYQSRVNRSQKLEKELLRLQTQLATNQLDPHFVSNALNSINALVLLNKNIDAFESLVKFSNLVEETLRSSDHITRTIEAELSFVGHFLDLEKKRKANFDYRFNIDSNVDKKTLVPKMVIHIFAENAVKHGFSGSEKGGLLVIDVSQKQGLLEIILKDNGIGFKKAAKKSEYSTKKGLMTISKIFDLHQKLNNRNISYEIKNLAPENDGQTGTQICIKIETNQGRGD